MLTHKDLAFFGGRPAFSRARPIGQLGLPDEAAFMELVGRAYRAGRLTANGSIVLELEARLAGWHEVQHCVSVVSAGVGLILLMSLLSRGRRGEVIIPAFGYNGLPHFVQWAKQKPVFCDVDPLSHGLDLRMVDSLVSDSTTSILGLPHFHDNGQIEELSGLGARRGIPVFFDSVNAIGSSYRGTPLGRFGAAHIFSMHATKLINGFEGGYLVTQDDDIAHAFRNVRDHAFNADLNELHAAMALANLDGIVATIAANRERYEAYERHFRDIRGLELLEYRQPPEDFTAYPFVVAEVTPEWPHTRDETVSILRAEGAAINPHYSPPLHRSIHAPPGLPVPSLPVAESLAQRFVQLPAGDLTSIDDVHRLCERLKVLAP